MPSFDVLERGLNIHQSYLLEASAGTGKTFSIENLFVRLLIEAKGDEKESCRIDQILVVTFTRAATKELKIRIRAHLERALSHLKGETSEKRPDYLQAVLDSGTSAVEKGVIRLERALAVFDEAQIFTIHSFARACCASMPLKAMWSSILSGKKIALPVFFSIRL